MNRKTVFALGEYYHIYNRGTDKRTIFRNTHDRKRFVALLYACNSNAPIHVSDFFEKGRAADIFTLERGEPLVDICAYVLMSNHFHLLLKEKVEGGIGRFMQKLGTGYVMYFNQMERRSGGLFQGAYKAEHVASDRYLKYLISYIHLNPVKILQEDWKEVGIRNKKEAFTHLEHYAYSSFLDFMGVIRPENSILNRVALPNYFPAPRNFENEILEWLAYRSPKNVKVRP